MKLKKMTKEFLKGKIQNDNNTKSSEYLVGGAWGGDLVKISIKDQKVAQRIVYS